MTDFELAKPALAMNTATREQCTLQHDCGGHTRGHVHGPGCGHPQIAHDDHSDYLVGDHLHHPHEGHCDDHGPME